MNALPRNADAGLVVLDPAAVGVLGTIDDIQEMVDRARVKMVPAWWAVGEPGAEAVEAVAEDDDRIAARGAPADKLYVSLGCGRRPAGRRPHALDVDDDQWHFAHDRQADAF